MVVQAQAKQYTPADYLELERQAEIRHEYIAGTIIPMTGGTPDHNQIALNLSGALNFALRQQLCRVFMSDQRLWIPEKQLYTYPDVMVVQGNLSFQEGRRDTLTNPVLIAEVLSPSTEAYDRGAKFAAYRTIPTLQEYLLISQSGYQVEQFTKTEDERWLLRDYSRDIDTLTLQSIAFTISLLDLYAKVEFVPAEQ